jgi:SP family sugar:H+ symporter-like MFS transporter
MYTIEHVGRRKSLLIGAAAQAVCAIIAALVGHFYTDNPNASVDKQMIGGNVLIAFAILHVSFYSLFWGPTPCKLPIERTVMRLMSRGHSGRDFPIKSQAQVYCSRSHVQLGTSRIRL